MHAQPDDIPASVLPGRPGFTGGSDDAPNFAPEGLSPEMPPEEASELELDPEPESGPGPIANAGPAASDPVVRSRVVPVAPAPPAGTAASESDPGMVVSPGDQFSPFSFNRRAFTVTGAALVLLLLIGGFSMFFLGRSDKGGDSQSLSPGQYLVGDQLELNDVKGGGQLQVGSAEQLTINGRLEVSNTLVLVPTSEPTSPVTGQIYYDKDSGAPYYFNGKVFVSLAPSTGGVSSLGGSDGDITLGNGLAIAGGRLSVSAALFQQILNGGAPGVSSLQGQTGAVRLTGGSGIDINGTTISNGGVITLVSGSPALTVTDDGRGNYTITSNVGGGNITGSGTSGRIAKFNAADGITDSGLIESGTTLTYGGNVIVNAANGFVGNLINLEVNSSSKLSVNQNGSTVQAGTLTVNGTGASSIAGSLSVGTGLSVTTGGIAVTGNSTIAGTLGSLTGLTSGGTITFSALNSNGVVHTNGAGVLSTGPVVLGSDTSGDYVSSLGSLTGLTTTGNSGAGSTPTLSVAYGSGANMAVQGNTALTVTAGTGLSGGGVITLGAGGSVSLDVDYGSIAGTAVQGNVALTCAAGTGNLTGGGNSVTLGAGGACNDITITDDPVFSGTLGVQGSGGITVGVAGSVAGIINLANGTNGNLATIQPATLGQATTYNLPDPGQASVDICLSTGNCAGSGGGITGSGTNGRIAKFTGTGTIADSTLSESGSTVTASGNVVIQGANSLTLGAATTNNGAILLKNSSNSNTLTIRSGVTAADLTLVLPTADGSNGDCLQTNGSGVLSFQACTGGPGGGVTSLDGLSGVLTIANSSGSGGTVTIDDAAADGATKGIAAFNSTNFSSLAGVINTAQDIHAAAAPTFAGLTLSSALTVANGGTGTNTFTANGILYGNGSSAIQATGAAADSILATNGSNVPGLTQTLPTAVQGNITSTGALAGGSITSGFGNISTGNLISTTSSLHGNTLTVGSSNQFQVDASGNFTTSGTGAVQSGSLTLGDPGSTAGSLYLANTSSTRQVILQGLNPTGTGNAVIQLPSIAGGDTDTVCLLTLANCVGTGGGIAGTGTPGQIAKFTASNTIADSGLSEAGTTLTYAGNAVINAANGFVGNLINLEVDGSSKLTVNENGDSVQAGTLIVNGTGASSVAGTLSIGTLGSGGTTALCSNGGVIGTCASTGSVGFWNRTGTTLQPSTADDNISTSGNISTTGSGTLSVAGTSTLTGNVGVGTASPNTSLTVYNSNESTTQTDFTGALNKGGINIVTDFTDQAYTPGVFWSTQDNNPTKPKAGIYTFEDATFGTSLLFGTSNAYSTGITNTALTLGPLGQAAFRNGTNSATGFQVQNAIGTGLFTVNTITGAALTTSLFIDSLGSGGSTALCLNGSSQVSTCSGTGAPFIQGGNSFGATAILGTNDNNGLDIRTNGTTVASFTSTGAAVFQNSSNSTSAFQIQNSSSQPLFNANTSGGYVINNGHRSAWDNLLENGGFESDGASRADGWEHYNGSAQIGTGANARSGNRYFSMVPDGTNASTCAVKQIEVVPGQNYYLEGYVKTAVGTNGQGGFYLEWRDKSFSSLSFSNSTWTNPGTSYTLRTVTATAPANAHYLRICMTTRSDSNTGTWYFDDLYAAKASQQAPFVFQNTANSTTALRVLDSSGNNALVVDTEHNTIGLGSTAATTIRQYIWAGSTYDGLMIDQDASNSNNLLNLAHNGTNVVTFGGTGQTLFKNSTDSATAFQIQNTNSDVLLQVDTSSYDNYLEGNGNINILSGTSLNIGDNSIIGENAVTGDLQIDTYNGAVTSFYTEHMRIRSGTDNDTAFEIQNADGDALFNADTENLRINVTGDVNVGTRFGNRLFSDNFESGGLALWDGGTDGADTSTAEVHAGRYSALLNPAGTDASAATGIAASDDVYIRAWVYVDSQTSPNADLLQLGTDGWTNYWVAYRNGGNIRLYNGAEDTDVGSGGALTTDEWHLLEMRVTIGDGTGVSQLWLDGTQVLSDTGESNGTDPIVNAAIGDVDGRTFTAYLDDVVVDTEPTGTASSLNVDDSLHVGGTATFGGSLLVNVADEDKAGISLYEANDRGFNLFYDGGPNQFVLQANDAGTISDVFTVQRTDGSAVFRNSVDSEGAFYIQQADGDSVFGVDTANRRIGVNVDTPETEIQVCGAGANCSEGRLSFGDYDPVDWQGVFVGEYGTGDTNELQLQGANAVYITNGAGAGDIAAKFSIDNDRDAGVMELGVNTSGGYIQFNNDDDFQWSIGIDSFDPCDGLAGNNDLYFYTSAGGCALSFLQNTGAATFYASNVDDAFRVLNGDKSRVFGVDNTDPLYANATIGSSDTTDGSELSFQYDTSEWDIGAGGWASGYYIENASDNLVLNIQNDGSIRLNSGVTNGTLFADIAGTGTTRAICHSGAAGATENIQIVDCTGTPAADYAENYPVAQGAAYGDVVAMGTHMVNTYDTDEDGDIDWTSVKGRITQLVKSTAPYQANTVGIISDNHGDFSSVGHNIKEEDNPMPVALNGRVPVNLAAGSDAIQPGDYITTSSEPGKAMKATGAGFVIGKALEAWTPGSGDTQVMVFVEQGYWPGPSQTDMIQNGGDATLNDLTVGGMANIAGLNVSGAATISDLTVTGTATVAELHVTGDASFDGPTVSFSSNVRGINQHIGDGEHSVTIDFATAHPDADYGVQCTPSYNTTCYVTDKTAESFTINFGTAPPDADETVDWFVVR